MENEVFHNIMICCQGIGLPSFVMACELFAAKYRTFAGIFIANVWAIVVCVFALLAYLVPNWVHLQLIISLMGLLSIPLYWYYDLRNALLYAFTIAFLRLYR